MASKKPSHKGNPSEKKIPRGINKAAQSEIERIAWHIRVIDKGGSWGWGEVEAPTVWKHIFSKMASFETMTWSEILNRNNHAIPFSDICPKAQKRLAEINQDDIDELISLRLTGIKRIWGIRECNIFKILWWDPNHTVYPTTKK